MRMLPINVDSKTRFDVKEDREKLLSLMSGLWDAQPGKNDLPPEEFERLVKARQAFRSGDLFLTCTLLSRLNCAEALNLCGVVHEVLGDHEGARQRYQKALAANRECFAAEQNLRRSYELWEFGRSDIPYVL